MELGFPGNKKMEITYTLTEQNQIRLDYRAESDKTTVVNLANHTYFNLAGHDSGIMEDQLLWINADHYTPVAPGNIPTGEIAPVAGTPMDFTKQKKIGAQIKDDFEQLKLVGGYDHNYVLNDYNGELKYIAEAKDGKSGRTMKVFTNLPGVQFYAGNFIEEKKYVKCVLVRA